MILALTWGIVIASAIVMVIAAWFAWRDLLFNDVLLVLVGLIELAALVQAFRGLTTMGAISDPDERVTFAAYVLTLPFIPIGTAWLALKDKTRWAMGALAVGAFAVAVMTIRCQQIWSLHA